MKVLPVLIGFMVFMSSAAIAQDSSPVGSTTGSTVKPALIAQIRREDSIIAKLNLTVAQKQQIQQVHQQYQPQILTKAQQFRQSQLKMQALLKNQNASNQQLQMQHQESARLRRDLSNLEFQKMLAIRAILTVQQRQILGNNITQNSRLRGQ